MLNDYWRPVRFIAGAALACASFGWVAPAVAAPLKVACTGTTALLGVGSSEGHHVPDELGRALGPEFEVKNFGKQGATAIKALDSSYAASEQMQAALAYDPDIVVIWFGGNDSMEGTWEAHQNEFSADYTSIVDAFQALPSHPKTFLVRLWVFVDSPVRRSVLDQQILPRIDQIAVDTGSTLIDYRKAFEAHADYFPDGMHPNDTGTLAIGKLFAEAITTKLSEPSSGGSGGAGGGASAGSGGAAGSGGGGMAPTSGGGSTATAGAAPVAGGSSAAGGAGGSTLGGASGSASVAGTASSPAASGTSADSSGCVMSRPAAASHAAWFSLFVVLGLAGRRARRAKGERRAKQRPPCPISLP
jgi:lysophospholipase L1-like esterase